METISRRIRGLEESPTLAFTRKARLMREAGIDVVSLTAGEPDFPTPRHIKDAAISAIEDNFTHYTANEGTSELVGAIIDKFAADNGLHFTPEQIMVSSGAKQSIFNALCAILNPGDEVVIPAPYWVSYPAMVRLADGVPVTVPMPAGSGFRPDVRLLRKAIGPRTRLLIINTPCNPTGTVLTRGEIGELAALVSDTGIMVISDEIYEKVIFDGRRHESIGAVEGIADRVITVNGVSKAYAMTGWRIGYMGGPGEIIRAAARVQGQTTNNANSIAQKATVAALRGPQAPIRAMTAEFQSRRDHVVRRLSTLRNAIVPLPDGAMYAFVNVAGYFTDGASGSVVRSASDIARYLLELHHVAVVPGEAFGDPECVRLSFACSMEELEKGMDRIVRGLTELEN